MTEEYQLPIDEYLDEIEAQEKEEEPQGTTPTRKDYARLLAEETAKRKELEKQLRVINAKLELTRNIKRTHEDFREGRLKDMTLEEKETYLRNLYFVDPKTGKKSKLDLLPRW